MQPGNMSPRCVAINFVLANSLYSVMAKIPILNNEIGNITG